MLMCNNPNEKKITTGLKKNKRKNKYHRLIITELHAPDLRLCDYVFIYQRAKHSYTKSPTSTSIVT